MSRIEGAWRWIESGGGPLLFLSARLASHWGGTLPPPNDAVSGDYARAVEVTEYLGSIRVAHGKALVLGGDPLPATMVRVDPGLVIARWVYANSDDAATRALENAKALPYKPESFLFHNDDDAVVLMDAAYTADAAPERLISPLSAGTYGIATAEFKPDEETFFMIHRLEKL